MSQPDEAQPIQDFFRFVERERKYPGIDPSSPETISLNLINPIKAYFDENSHEKLNAILAALFKPEEPPDLAEVIIQNYTTGFSILLHIGKGKFIEVFAEHNNLEDGHLPFDSSNKPPHFPNSSDDSFFETFCQKQWRFCSPIFSPHLLYNKHFHEELVLPIATKELLGKGGSAILYKIRIYDEHNRLLPDNMKIKLSPEYANTFVLKTYISKNPEKNYNNERLAFTKLKNARHIIGYYGSFRHRGMYNILLEYADKGDLERFFMEVDPPNNGKDILNFWKGIFNVLVALMAIHAVKPQGDRDAPPVFQGLHQDVKPQNVLVVSNERTSPHEWQFKLGDLGLSQFEKFASLKHGAAIDAQGTRTYGAPECYRADEVLAAAQLPVTPAADIWSLGCIYSEAARWVATGKRGLLAYRQARLSETEKIPNFEDGNCFHDGQHILQAVRNSHEATMSSLHEEDTITQRVLERMVDEMLQSEPDTRPNAKQLWAKILKILSDAEADLGNTGGEGSMFPTSQRPPPPPVLPPGMTPDYYHPHVSHWVRLNSVDPNHARSLPTVTSEFGSMSNDGELSHSPDGLADAEEQVFRFQKSHVSGGSIPQILPTVPQSAGRSMYDGSKQGRRQTLWERQSADGSPKLGNPFISDRSKTLDLPQGGSSSASSVKQVVRRPGDFSVKLGSKQVSPQEPNINLTATTPRSVSSYTGIQTTQRVDKHASYNGALGGVQTDLDPRRESSSIYNRELGALSEKLKECVKHWCQGVSNSASIRSRSPDPMGAVYVLACPRLHPISYSSLKRLIEQDQRRTGLKDLISNEPEFEVDIRCPSCDSRSRTLVKWARQIEPLLFISAEMDKVVGTPSLDRSTTLPMTSPTIESQEVDDNRLTTSSSNSTNISSSSNHVDLFNSTTAGQNETVHDRKNLAESSPKQKSSIKTRPLYTFSADGLSLLLWARDADRVVLYEISSGRPRDFPATGVHLAARGANLFATVSKLGFYENLRVHEAIHGAEIASVLLEGPITSIALSRNNEFVALGNSDKALVYNTSNMQLVWKHELAPFEDLKLKHQRVWFSTDSEKLIAATRNTNGDVYTYVSNCTNPANICTVSHINIPPGLHKDFGISAALYDNTFGYAFVTAFTSAAPPALFSLQSPPRVERLDRTDLGTQIQCAASPPNANKPEFVLVNGDNYIFSVQGHPGSLRELKKKWRLPGSPIFLREEMTAIAMPAHNVIYAFRVEGKNRFLTTIIGDKLSTSEISKKLPI